MLRLRTWVCLVIALLFVGVGIAAEGVITKTERGKITVKVGDKEQEVETKGVKVTGADGAELKGKDRGQVLKKDQKVELIEKDGKVVEIKAK
jgi:hypothetical protein